MKQLIATIDYRDDISDKKPWGTESMMVTLELRRGDGVVIYKEYANELSALANSPLHLLRQFLKGIEATG